jgi:CubicO group peptidase (beta-lactamase class C family)
MNYKVCFLLFFITFHSFVFSELQIKEKIHEECKSFLQKNNGSGLSVAIFKNHIKMKTPYEEVFSFGQARRSSKTLVYDTTIYRLGPLSKIFTSLLLLKLLSENKMDINEEAQMYLPKNFILPKPVKGIVSIEDLAYSVSGLSNHLTIPIKEYKASESDIKIYFKAIKQIKESKKKYEPSDLGFSCLNLMISNIKKKKYEDVLKEELFLPFDMKHSFFTLPLEKISKVASGHKGIKEVREDFLEREGSFFKTSRGALSSILDIQKILRAFLSENQMGSIKYPKTLYGYRLIKPDLFQEESCMGFTIKKLKRGKDFKVYVISSQHLGFSHFFALCPDLQIGCAILSNSEYPVENLGIELMEHLAQ